MSRLDSLRHAVARETRRLDGKMGVFLERLGREGRVEVRADEAFPLASVFKLGVLVELFRRVDAGTIRLDRRVTVREKDMCPGGEILEFLDPGIRPTVRDLAEMMIIVSDNTATDILFKTVGLRSVNRAMRSLGLRSLDIFCPNREWYLLLLGYSPRFRGTDAAVLRRRWESLDAEGRIAEMEWLWKHRNKVTREGMRTRLQEQELAGWTRGRPWRLWEETTDNHGTPVDVGRLLESIGRSKAASPRSCATMVRILEDQQIHRLSLGLPPGTRVASKTGSIAGVINDSGIVFPKSQPPFVVVCLSEDLTPRQEAEAPRAIARVARAAWRAWGDP